MELAPLEKGFLCLLSPPATTGELGMEQVPTEMAGEAGYVDGGCGKEGRLRGRGCVIPGPRTRLGLRQLLPRGSVDMVLPHLVSF